RVVDLGFVCYKWCSVITEYRVDAIDFGDICSREHGCDNESPVNQVSANGSPRYMHYVVGVSILDAWQSGLNQKPRPTRIAIDLDGPASAFSVGARAWRYEEMPLPL